MPNNNDIIRDLCYNENFFDEGRRGCVDEVHCDRERQYFFLSPNELEELDYEELRGGIRRVIAARERLEAFVKYKHLYYGVFHTEAHYNLGFITCDTIYALGVGESPNNGNLVVFGMQVFHNMTS